MRKILIATCLLLTISNITAQNIKDSLSINEVVVTGTRIQTDSRYLPLNVSSINRLTIENSYEPSLLPVLNEQVPGLFVTSRGIMGYGLSTGASGNMKIRGIGGSPTTEILVLIDGHPQYMGLMGHTLADVYQSLLAEKVEVVSGPASVLYGNNAMGGVINILTRHQINDGTHNKIRIGTGPYGTLTSEYAGMLKKGKFHAIAAGSYNRTDGHRRNMAFGQATGLAKLGYDFSEIWKINASFSLTHFNSSNPGTVDSRLSDNDMHITRGMASATLSNGYQQTQGSLTFFYNWGKHKINDGYAEGEQPKDYLFRSKDDMYGVNWYQTISLFEGNHITFGFDYQHIYGEAWNDVNDGTRTDIADRQADEIAGYVDFRQTLFDILTFDGGLRYDYHSHCGDIWVPQAGLSLSLPHDAELKTLVSRGFRNPTLKDLYMFRPKNSNLQPEKMMNYEVSYKQNLLDRHLKYGVDLFYINASNLIETVMSDGRPLNQNTGKEENWGFETEVAYQFCNSFSASGNYSYLHTQHGITAAPRHKLYLEGVYHHDRFNVSTGVQWIGHLLTATSPEQIEDFVLWNIRASYQATNWLKLYAKGENLLAQKYEINESFPMPRATFMCGIEITF